MLHRSMLLLSLTCLTCLAPNLLSATTAPQEAQPGTTHVTAQAHYWNLRKLDENSISTPWLGNVVRKEWGTQPLGKWAFGGALQLRHHLGSRSSLSAQYQFLGSSSSHTFDMPKKNATVDKRKSKSNMEGSAFT